MVETLLLSGLCIYIIYTEYSATDYSAYKLTSYETLTLLQTVRWIQLRQRVSQQSARVCRRAANRKTAKRAISNYFYNEVVSSR